MKRTVFYSWQSDLPHKANRNFIQDALERAAKAIAADDSLAIEPVIDRDTAGVPGSPNIAEIILEKIAAADIVVADVSIINRQGEGPELLKTRPSPNPNVLVELGYAFRAIGHDRVTLVFNTAFGKVEELPFDLRGLRVTSYYMPANVDDRSSERKSLQKKLEEAFRVILPELKAKKSVEIFVQGSTAIPTLGSESSIHPGFTVYSCKVTVVTFTTSPIKITAKRLLVDEVDWPVESIFFQLKSRAKEPTIVMRGNDHEDFTLYLRILTKNSPSKKLGIVEFEIGEHAELLKMTVQFP